MKERNGIRLFCSILIMIIFLILTIQSSTSQLGEDNTTLSRDKGRIKIENPNYLIDWDLEISGKSPSLDKYIVEGILQSKDITRTGDIRIISPARFLAGSKAYVQKDTRNSYLEEKTYFCQGTNYGWITPQKVAFCNSSDGHVVLNVTKGYYFKITPKNATITWNDTIIENKKRTFDVTSLFDYSFNPSQYGDHEYKVPNATFKKGQKYKLRFELKINESDLPLKYTICYNDFCLDPTITNSRTWSTEDDFNNNTVIRNNRGWQDEVEGGGFSLNMKGMFDNLEHIYPFDEDLLDVMREDNFSGTYERFNTTSSKSGQSLQFGSANQKITSDKNHEFTGSSLRCYSFHWWLEHSTSQLTLLSIGTSGSTRKHWEWVADGTNMYMDVWGDNIATGETLDTWVHTVMTKNSSGWALWQDGTRIGLDTDALNTEADRTVIGNRQYGNNNDWDGKIDELYIYKAGCTQWQIDRLSNDTYYPFLHTERELSDTQGWSPQSSNHWINMTVELVMGENTSAIFNYSYDNSSWTASNLTVNGTNTVDLSSSSADDPLYYKFHLYGYGKTNLNITSYTLHEGAVASADPQNNMTPNPSSDLLNTSNGYYNVTLNSSSSCHDKCILYQDGTNVVNFSEFPYVRTGLTNASSYSFNYTQYNSTFNISESNFSNTITITTWQTEQWKPQNNMTPNPSSDLLNTSNGYYNVTLNSSSSCHDKCLIYQDGVNVKNISSFPDTVTGLLNASSYSFNYTMINNTYNISTSNFSNTITITTWQTTQVRDTLLLENVSCSSTSGNNISTDDWTCSWDGDGGAEPIFNTSWFNSSSKKAVLVMDFNFNYSNNNIRDLTQNENNATNNGTTYNATGGLFNSGAYTFDGVDDNLGTIDGYVELFPNGFPFTLSGWYKTKDDNTGQARDIFGISDSSQQNNFYSIEVRRGNASMTARNGVSFYSLSHNVNGADGIWHYIVGVYHNDTSKKLYVDGEYIGELTDNITYGSNIDGFSIGRLGDSSPGDYFNGSIDNVIGYNYALSPAQIKHIWQNNSNVLNTSETSNNERWQFNVISADSDGYTSLVTEIFTINITNPITNKHNFNLSILVDGADFHLNNSQVTHKQGILGRKPQLKIKSNDTINSANITWCSGSSQSASCSGDTCYLLLDYCEANKGVQITATLDNTDAETVTFDWFPYPKFEDLASYTGDYDGMFVEDRDYYINLWNNPTPNSPVSNYKSTPGPSFVGRNPVLYDTVAGDYCANLNSPYDCENMGGYLYNDSRQLWSGNQNSKYGQCEWYAQEYYVNGNANSGYNCLYDNCSWGNLSYYCYESFDIGYWSDSDGSGPGANSDWSTALMRSCVAYSLIANNFTEAKRNRTNQAILNEVAQLWLRVNRSRSTVVLPPNTEHLQASAMAVCSAVVGDYTSPRVESCVSNQLNSTTNQTYCNALSGYPLSFNQTNLHASWFYNKSMDILFAKDTTDSDNQIPRWFESIRRSGRSVSGGIYSMDHFAGSGSNALAFMLGLQNTSFVNDTFIRNYDWHNKVMGFYHDSTTCNLPPYGYGTLGGNPECMAYGTLASFRDTDLNLYWTKYGYLNLNRSDYKAAGFQFIEWTQDVNDTWVTLDADVPPTDLEYLYVFANDSYNNLGRDFGMMRSNFTRNATVLLLDARNHYGGDTKDVNSKGAVILYSRQKTILPIAHEDTNNPALSSLPADEQAWLDPNAYGDTSISNYHSNTNSNDGYVQTGAGNNMILVDRKNFHYPSSSHLRNTTDSTPDSTYLTQSLQQTDFGFMSMNYTLGALFDTDTIYGYRNFLMPQRDMIFVIDKMESQNNETHSYILDMTLEDGDGTLSLDDTNWYANFTKSGVTSYISFKTTGTKINLGNITHHWIGDTLAENVTALRPNATGKNISIMWILIPKTSQECTPVFTDRSADDVLEEEVICGSSNFSIKYNESTDVIDFSEYTSGAMAYSFRQNSSGQLYSTSYDYLREGTTTVDATPPSITSVSNESTTNDTTYIKVVTNETANLSVEYGQTTNFGLTATNTTLATTSYVYISGLNITTTYFYNVTSCDNSGNCAENGTFNFTTGNNTAVDNIAPSIELISNFSITTSTFSVNITLNETANATLYYSTNADLSSSSSSSSSTYSTNHSFLVSGLGNNTIHYWQVNGSDSSGNTYNSTIYNVTTSQTTQSSGGSSGGGGGGSTPSCGDGKITSRCLCGGSSYQVGYCFNNVYYSDNPQNSSEEQEYIASDTVEGYNFTIQSEKYSYEQDEDLLLQVKTYFNGGLHDASEVQVKVYDENEFLVNDYYLTRENQGVFILDIINTLDEGKYKFNFITRFGSITIEKAKEIVISKQAWWHNTLRKSTGQINDLVYVLMGIIIVLVLLLLTVYYKKKKKK